MWGYAKDITQLMRLVNKKGLLGSDDRGLLLYRLSKVLGEGEKTLVCNTIVEPETPAYTRGNFTVYLRWVEGRQLWRG